MPEKKQKLPDWTRITIMIFVFLLIKLIVIYGLKADRLTGADFSCEPKTGAGMHFHIPEQKWGIKKPALDGRVYEIWRGLGDTEGEYFVRAYFTPYKYRDFHCDDFDGVGYVVRCQSGKENPDKFASHEFRFHTETHAFWMVSTYHRMNAQTGPTMPFLAVFVEQGNCVATGRNHTSGTGFIDKDGNERGPFTRDELSEALGRALGRAHARKRGYLK